MKEIPEGSVVCPFCAKPQDEAPTSAPTSAGTAEPAGPALDDAVTSLEAPAPGGAPTPAASPTTTPPPSHSDSGHHGQFLPGTTVAGRYRIIGLLGRGGMGEVYRADDLKLGQQVALKFLPRRMVANDEHIRLLFDEVRMARKVSHPNVCRVFDVAETDGQHYVSMEYVDGEDLSSLLRRIGRLPEDKAVEIARQLCAALAAAHDEGVLHRDLKPANIMLDGRGRVKLTDFGLAAVAEVRAGTPIYMAPEQLAGKEVSVKSDLYSLGLVLHELFTGRRVFEADDFNELSRLHENSMTSSLTSTGQLDPSIASVIHRCLEKEPGQRPGSALAVAAGLPGADPLAAALAAGETPSPELVAEAGGEGSLPLAIAAPLLLFSLAGAVAIGAVQWGQSLTGWVPMELSPAVLDARALEIVTDLGYDDAYVDTASAFAADLSYLAALRGEEEIEDRLDLVVAGRTPTVAYWWRGAGATLVPGGPTGVGFGGSVALSDPPRIEPGMIALQMDTLGRLTWLDVVPDRIDVADAAVAFEWSRLFDLMGLDIENFTEIPPRLTPEHFADERVAWEGAFPEYDGASLRIEAAALRGRPISLRFFTDHKPLEPPTTTPASTSGSGIRPATIAVVVIVGGTIGLLLTVIFGGLYVAQRNVRSGRGDQRGARRLGFAVAIALGVSWLLSEHSYSPNDVNDFITMLIYVGAIGGLTWALYLAVEPFTRRHAPEALIGWTRFVDGRFADPLVGRDVLLGCAAGVLARLMAITPLALGDRVSTVGSYIGLPIATPTELLSTVIGTATTYMLLALGMSFLYSLSFLATGRRPWLAYAGWLLLFAWPALASGLTINGVRPGATWPTAIFWTLGWALWLFVLIRPGLLVFMAMSTTSILLSTALPTLDFSAWYAASMITGLLLFFAIATYAFYRSVVWKGGLAEALGGD